MVVVVLAGSSLTAVAAAATRSIAVSPDAALVDGQQVTVTGQGFEPGATLTAYQCTADVDDCRHAIPVDAPIEAGADGSFTATARLRAVFPSRHGGSIDCRVAACSLAVDYAFRIDHAGRPSAQALATPEGDDDFPLELAPLAFDPSAPLQTPPTLVVTPDHDLVDGQRVRVTGGGYEPDQPLLLALCKPAPRSYGACDFSGAFPIDTHADAAGALDLEVTLFARMVGFDARPLDCRRHACSLVTFEQGLPDDRLGEAPLDFDPDAPLLPDPVVDAHPLTDLVDGQEVTIEGTGFRPGEGYFVEQCLDDDPGHDYWNCAGRYRAGQADANGEIHTTFAVRSSFESFQRVHCLTDPCVLALYPYAGGPTVVLPLRFDASAAPGPPPLEASCDLTTFTDPDELFLGGVTPGPDGNVWFDTIDQGDRAQVGNITPSGDLTLFDLGPDALQVQGLTAGPDGNVWFTLYDRVVRITPAGARTAFVDPRIDDAGDIVAGPDGALWFAQRASGGLGRVTVDGTFTFYDAAAVGAPDELGVGPDGQVWYSERTTDSIRRITPTGSVSTAAAGPFNVPSGLVTGPDGNVWTSERYEGKVVRISPSGQATRFGDPSVLAEPNDMVVGPDGAMWFVTAQNDRIGRVDADGTVTTYVDRDDELDEPRSLTLGPDGHLWVSAQNSGLHRVDRCGVPAARPVSAAPAFTG